MRPPISHPRTAKQPDEVPATHRNSPAFEDSSSGYYDHSGDQSASDAFTRPWRARRADGVNVKSLCCAGRAGRPMATKLDGCGCPRAAVAALMRSRAP
jgi:hypothetical protein